MADILLRIEDDNGYGPYCTKLGVFRDTSVKKNWPACTDEMFLISRFYGARFAFPSVKAMVKWFPSWQRKRLAKLGFKLVAVTSSQIEKDEAQAIFDPMCPEFRVLKEFSLTDHASKIEKQIKSLDLSAV